MPQMIMHIDMPEEYDIDEPFTEGYLIPDQTQHVTVWSEYNELGRCGGIMDSEEDATFDDVCNIIISGLCEKGLETSESIEKKLTSFIDEHYPMYVGFPVDEIMSDNVNEFYYEIWMVYINLLETVAHGHHVCGDKRRQ